MKREKDDIERYREGSLSESERHALEKKALNNPFLSDALEGVEQVSPDEFSRDLDSIAGKIQKGRFSIGFTPLRIAAGVLILVATGTLLYYFNLPRTEPLALENSPSSGKAGTVADSKIDSSSLLTMSQPEKKEEEAVPPSAKAKEKSLALAEQKQTDADVKPAPGVLHEEIKSEKEQSVKDKTEISEEIAEDKLVVSEPVQSVPLSTQGAGLSSKKEVSTNDLSKNDITNRSSKSASGKISNVFKFSGKVSSVDDGQPVSGANIIIKGSKRGTITDDGGNFNLALENPHQPLVVSSIGMNAQEVIPEDQSTMNIQLSENTTPLSEVVVTETPLDPVSTTEPVVKNAVPSGGLKKYNSYLENNLRYPSEARAGNIRGKVIVQFSISPDGQLSNFRVLKSLRQDCDQEVIRLIQDGPAWTPSISNRIPVTSEVKVKMKFDPQKANR